MITLFYQFTAANLLLCPICKANRITGMCAQGKAQISGFWSDLWFWTGTGCPD